MALLYKAEVQRGKIWQKVFAELLPEVPFWIWPDVVDPAEIRYLSAWEPLNGMTSLLPNLEVVFATRPGVDQFDLARFPGICFAGPVARPRHSVGHAGIRHIRHDILVCLLPLAAETRGILDRRLFDCLPEEAALV